MAVKDKKARFTPLVPPTHFQQQVGWGTRLDKHQLSPLYYAARDSKDRSAVAALMSAAADPHLGNSPLTDPLVSDEMKDYIRSLSN